MSRLMISEFKRYAFNIISQCALKNSSLLTDIKFNLSTKSNNYFTKFYIIKSFFQSCLPAQVPAQNVQLSTQRVNFNFLIGVILPLKFHLIYTEMEKYLFYILCP